MPKTTSDAHVHNTVTERGRRFSAFNLACLIGGPLFAIIEYTMTSELRTLLLIPLSIIAGFPYRDKGPAHEALMLRFRRKASAKPGSKTLSAPPFSNNGEIDTNPWNEVEMVVGRIQQGKKIVLLPMLTNSSRNYLTMYLKINSGAAGRWASGDSEEKYEWDRDYMKAIERSLIATKEPDLWYGTFAICRPADKTVGYEYNQRRIDERYREAAAAPEGADVDPVERLLGQEAMRRTQLIYDQAGEYTNYTAIRLPWPRRRFSWLLRRDSRIDVTDPKVFVKSNIYKTARQLITQLISCELDVEMASRYEVNNILLLTHCERFLDTRQTYTQRDREKVESKAEEFKDIRYMDQTPSARDKLWVPLSVTTDPDNPVYLKVDGSFIGAAYVDAIVADELLPGFQDVALATPKRISFNVATIAKTPLVPKEKRKAMYAETGKRMLGDLKSANNYISEDPGAVEAIDKAVERRQLLHRSGGRSGDFHIPIIWFGRTLEELEENFEMLTLAAANYYEFKRLASPAEIADAILATILVF